MYCYNCGSQLYNGISKCPFCHADLQVIGELIFDSTLSKIIPSCPQFNMNAEMRFQIGNYVISEPEKQVPHKIDRNLGLV